MASLPMTPIEVHRVTRQHTAHEPIEIAAWRFDEQVHMIGHQAVEIDANCEAFRACRHPLQEALPVGIIPEDALPPISATGNVVYPALDQ